MNKKEQLNLQYQDMDTFQKVLINHRWMLHLPDMYRLDNLIWLKAEEMVDAVPDVNKPYLSIHSHYMPKEEFYAPYVKYVLEAQLVMAARKDWYDSTEAVLSPLSYPVPKEKADQKALIDYFVEGVKHPVFGEMHPEHRKQLDEVQKKKEDALKRWT